MNHADSRRAPVPTDLRSAWIGIGLLLVLALVVGALHQLNGAWPSGGNALGLPVARELPNDTVRTREEIAFFSARVRRDPQDAGAQNRLANDLLKLLRETGDLQYLEAASRAARASLAAVPAVRNANGLEVLIATEAASHDFAAARGHALLLTRLDPARSLPYALLGDAQIELGDYELAAQSYAAMRARAHGLDETAETRLARLAFLRGDDDGATSRLGTALRIALARPEPARDIVAFCRWQLGEIAFARGDYAAAEQTERDALVTFPGYHRALASLGRVRAARGDRREAIASYEDAVRQLPDPAYLAALGDLYALENDTPRATAQFDLVEAIGRLGVANGVLYNRQLALFHADHGRSLAQAYTNARREYAVRRDVYGADALAWTAFKTGHVREARRAARASLRLGTHDPRLWYHAGVIDTAMHDPAGKAELDRAFALSPRFDPMAAR